MQKIGQILNSFNQKNILVIGDVMLDKYIFGDVSRINPEAPVPVVNIDDSFNSVESLERLSKSIS